MQQKLTIEFFEQEGRRPVPDFLEGLEPAKKALTMHLLELLEAEGKALPEPYCKESRGGIWDLRCRTGNSQWHLLYFFPEKGGSIVVAGAFKKKTLHVPEDEIKTALLRKAYYEAHN